MKRFLSIAAASLLIAAAPPGAVVVHSTVVIPGFSVADASVAENAGQATVTIAKSGKATSYSKVSVTTLDGTAKAGVDYTAVSKSITFGNNQLSAAVPIAIMLRPGYQGDRSFTVHITVSRDGAVTRSAATVTIRETEPAPAPVVWSKCADEGGACAVSGTANVRYGSATTWTAPRAVTGSIACDNATWGDPLFGIVKECDTDGVVAVPPPPAPPPPAPSGAWVPAPLTVGGYAWLANGGPCCNGLIVKIVAGGTTSDSHPQHWWAFQYFADPSGNFPASNNYWSTAIMYGYDDSLQGIAPAP